MLVNFQLKGIEGWLALTGKLQKRYKDFERPFQKASVLIVASINKNFIAQGRPKKWEPLSFITRLIRGKGAKILRNTGNLQQSITAWNDVSKGMFGAITNVPYAKLLHSGGMSKGGTATVPKTRIPSFVRLQQVRAKQGGYKKVYVNVKAYTRKPYTITLKPSPVPARPFMMTQAEDLPRIRMIFKEHLNGKQD